MITAEDIRKNEILAAIADKYKKQPAYKYRISELTELQKQHMAYLLDHSTACGMITAGHIARGEHGDITLMEVFKPMINGNDKHCENAAKALAFKVLKFDNFGTLVLKEV